MVRHTHASEPSLSISAGRPRRFGAVLASLATSTALALTLAAAPLALAAESTTAADTQAAWTTAPAADGQAATATAAAPAVRAQAAAPSAARAQSAPARAPQSGAGSATVLVYMNGSDLESMAGEASMDISEMVQSGIGENANVVIETLGTSQWQGFGIASDHTQRYAVESGELKLVDDSLGQLDTTSPDTLSDFIRWGVENYPADRYILLFWDHGAGPVYGFGYDEFQSDYSALTLDEIQQALKANSDVHFDIIGMDCCIMSSLETCYALEPFCDYTVLSEDFEPGSGWSYTNWMSKLEQNPGIDTKELGGIIVDDMVSAVETDEPGMNATLALIDESKVPALYQAWVDFAYANKDSLLESNYSQEAEWQRGSDDEAQGQEDADASRAEASSRKADGDGTWGATGSWGDSRDQNDYGYSGNSGNWNGYGGWDNDGYSDGWDGYGNSGGWDNSDGYSDSGSWDDSGNWGNSGGWSDGYDSGGYGDWDGYGNTDGYGNANGWDSWDGYGNSGSWGGNDDWGTLDDWSQLFDLWNGDASYVTMTDYFITDLGQVASSIDGDKADALKSAIDDAIVHYSATEGDKGMSGLGVTLPYGDAEFYDQLEQVFKACGIDSSYVDWLEAFVDAPGASNFYDYSSNPDGNADAYGYGNGFDEYGQSESDRDLQSYDPFENMMQFAA